MLFQRDEVSGNPLEGDGFDVVGFIMAYEMGEINDHDVIVDGFQHMIDSGTVWSLQGSYGRTARALIDNGFCTEGT